MKRSMTLQLLSLLCLPALLTACSQSGDSTVAASQTAQTAKSSDENQNSSGNEPKWNISRRASNDPELAAAKREAQKHWPMFRDKFTSTASKSEFSIKVPFSDGEHTEHMWLEVNSIDGEEIKGTISNTPDVLKNLKAGQTVKVPRAEVEDLSYPAEGKQIGGWSIAVFLKRNPELKDKLPVYEQPQ